MFTPANISMTGLFVLRLVALFEHLFSRRKFSPLCSGTVKTETALDWSLTSLRFVYLCLKNLNSQLSNRKAMLEKVSSLVSSFHCFFFALLFLTEKINSVLLMRLFLF